MLLGLSSLCTSGHVMCMVNFGIILWIALSAFLVFSQLGIVPILCSSWLLYFIFRLNPPLQTLNCKLPMLRVMLAGAAASAPADIRPGRDRLLLRLAWLLERINPQDAPNWHTYKCSGKLTSVRDAGVIWNFVCRHVAYKLIVSCVQFGLAWYSASYQSIG